MMSDIRSTVSRLARTQRRLARDTSGLALLEFAFSLPLVLMIGLYGLETANQALVNLKISQIALNLADNASRVGLINGSTSVEQLREIDMNDVLQAARNQGDGIQLTTRGRITVSSLENVGGAQRIHWQRCIGLKSGIGYDSSYGVASRTGTSKTGPYDPDAGVNTATAPADNSASHPGSVAIGGANGVTLSGMGDDAASALGVSSRSAIHSAPTPTVAAIPAAASASVAAFIVSAPVEVMAPASGRSASAIGVKGDGRAHSGSRASRQCTPSRPPERSSRSRS